MPIAKLLRDSKAPSRTLSERRQAAWLQSEYSDPVWRVADTDNPKKTKIIDFRQVLADGQMLTEVEGLYATVKEFAWWLRDRRFSNVNDALGHQILVRNLIYIAHALTMERKFSFRYLDAYFLEKFIEKAALGLDAVIDASRRVQVFAASVDHECIERIAGMRIHRNRVIAAKRVAEACNLPGGTLALPRVADAIGRLAISVGLKPPRKAGGNAEPLRTLTVAALGRWLTPLEHLYAMRDVMEAQSLKERPFPEGAHSLAADLGAETESTPTVPPFLAIKLMEYSARTVLEASELEVGGAISSATVVDLLTACWVIVATFTARRAEEIFELSDHSDGDENPGGCLEGNRSNGWYLRIYIAKTHKETTWIPVPELLVRAIEILRIISAEARLKSGGQFLFRWLDARGEPRRFDASDRLDRFALNADAIAYTTQDGEEASWHWSPHQFRRFFAIMYFYRFEGATIESLSYFLRHISTAMTRRYILEDPDAVKIWRNVHWAYTGHFARSIVAGERAISGAGGERLKKTVRRIKDMLRRNPSCIP